jgi:hypothetical protein
MKGIGGRIAASTGAELCPDRAIVIVAGIPALAAAKLADLTGQAGVAACAAVSWSNFGVPARSITACGPRIVRFAASVIATGPTLRAALTTAAGLRLVAAGEAVLAALLML